MPADSADSVDSADSAKVFIVTGANCGLGKATVRRLIEDK